VNERGLTLLEVLLAAALGSVVALGVSSFYVSAQSFSAQSTAHAYLQRQGTLILDEMARQIQPASALTRGTCNADPQSLGITNGGGAYCFYTSGGQLTESRPGGGPWNLLAGSPVPFTLSSFTTTLTGGTRATISFTLADNAANSMTFTTDITRRN